MPVARLLLVLLCATSLSHAVKSVWDSPDDLWDHLIAPHTTNVPKLPDSTLYDLNLFSGVTNMSIRALGDFNNDQVTDAIALVNSGDGEHSIEVLTFVRESFTFVRLASATITGLSDVRNIAAGDFSYDGRLDLLVAERAPDANATTLTVYLQSGDLSFKPGVTAKERAHGEVIVVDYDRDNRLDLFGVNWRGERGFWRNKQASGQTRDAFPGFEFVRIGGGGPPGLVSEPAILAFVDVDGDCDADLVVGEPRDAAKCQQAAEGGTAAAAVDACRPGSLSFYFQDDASKAWLLVNTTKFPDEMKIDSVAFSDFDQSGSMDMVVAVCDAAPDATVCARSGVHVLLNRQAERDANAQCKPDAGWGFMFDDDEAIVSAEMPAELSLARGVDPQNGGAVLPAALRVGDLVLDGYDDLLVAVVNRSDPERRVFAATLDNAACAPADNCTIKFVLNTALANLTRPDGAAPSEHVFAASWMDFGDKGSLDVLLQTHDTETGAVVVHTLFNNLRSARTTNYWVQMKGLNGVCFDWCAAPRDTFSDPKPWGVNFPGGVHKFTYFDREPALHFRMGCQLTQSSYLALQSPAVMFGLGESDNYISVYFYGTTAPATPARNGPLGSSEGHWRSFSDGVFVRSRSTVSPYGLDAPLGWMQYQELYPSSVVFLIFIVVIACVIALGTLICYFVCKESRQDKKERGNAPTAFSFSAF